VEIGVLFYCIVFGVERATVVFATGEMLLS